jgi:hypothetical protein
MSEPRAAGEELDLRPSEEVGEEDLAAKRELPRPTAEEIEALQPTAEEIKEIEEVEALQAIARRCLEDPEAVGQVRPAAQSALGELEYLGLYVALALRESGAGEMTGATADESLYTLCVTALTRFRAGDIPALPGGAVGTDPQAPPGEVRAAQPTGDETGRLRADAAVYESLLRERDAQLAEKDREIERLAKALEEAQAALLRQEEELLSRVQAHIALQALQQTEEAPTEEAPQPLAGATAPPQEPSAPEKRPWWQRKKI